MFICGNDANAKREVTAILDQSGWESEDTGVLKGPAPLSRYASHHVFPVSPAINGARPLNC